YPILSAVFARPWYFASSTVNRICATRPALRFAASWNHAAMPSLTVSSKYLRVAARIEAELRTGACEGGKMPSVRGITPQYGVPVVTASRALQVPRDKGLTQTIERSGCYRIPPPTADRWAVCLRLTPGTAQRETFSIAQNGFLAVARTSPMHLEFDAF